MQRYLNGRNFPVRFTIYQIINFTTYSQDPQSLPFKMDCSILDATVHYGLWELINDRVHHVSILLVVVTTFVATSAQKHRCKTCKYPPLDLDAGYQVDVCYGCVCGCGDNEIYGQCSCASLGRAYLIFEDDPGFPM